MILDSNEYMESEVIDTGSFTIELDQNFYDTGDDGVLKYRIGATVEACEAASWNAYTVPFASSGFVQVRVENT